MDEKDMYMTMLETILREDVSAETLLVAVLVLP